MATLKPQFNERLFEFCVNAELVGTLGSVIAGYVPGIPSPQEEETLGWDASFPFPDYGVTYLLQYKTARRTTAKAGPNARFWNAYGEEYFRFSLHRDKTGAYTQHQRLVDACAPGIVPAYVAPVFQEQGSLVSALQSGAVLDSSAVIPVESLGPIMDTAAHSVTYPVDGTSGKEPNLHSEPRRVGRLYRESFRRSESRTARLDESQFHELAEVVTDRSVKPRRRRTERPVRAEDPRAEAFLRAAAAAADELDATLVIVPDKS